MNRRQSLGVLFGKHRTKESSVSEQNTLAPYSGEWSFQQAAHLLRRTTFGPTPAQIKTAVKDGLEKTIQTIFEEQPISDPYF